MRRTRWITQVALRNLAAFTSLSFPFAIIMPYELVLGRLPALETVNLSAPG